MRTATALLLLFASLRVVGQADLDKPFRECHIQGSITIYDYQSKRWIMSNPADSRLGTLPASTFKVLNTLIALETGVVADEQEIIKWPGKTDTVKYGYRPDIYHDMSLQEAFKLSAGRVYVELAKRIGKQRYQQFLATSNYGNVDLTIDDADFWNFGKLAISPANQIDILVGVYQETLPFSKRSFQILKQVMIEEQTDHYTLRAKTGWTRDGGKDTGWWIGYVERKDNVFFFATRLVKDRNSYNPDFAKCRKEITKTVLKQLHMLE